MTVHLGAAFSSRASLEEFTLGVVDILRFLLLDYSDVARIVCDLEYRASGMPQIDETYADIVAALRAAQRGYHGVQPEAKGHKVIDEWISRIEAARVRGVRGRAELVDVANEIWEREKFFDPTANVGGVREHTALAWKLINDVIAASPAPNTAIQDAAG